MRVGVISKLIKSEHGEILQAIDLEFCKKLEFYGIKAEILSYHNPCLDELEGLIISGGNDLNSIVSSDINEIRDNFEIKCINIAYENNIKILGICKGAQSLANFLGAQFVKTNEHVGEHEIDFLGKKMKVNSYHNYAIKAISNADILAFSTDKNIEAFMQKSHRILGAMWHFEREKTPSEASGKLFEIFKDEL